MVIVIIVVVVIAVVVDVVVVVFVVVVVVVGLIVVIVVVGDDDIHVFALLDAFDVDVVVVVDISWLIVSCRVLTSCGKDTSRNFW